MRKSQNADLLKNPLKTKNYLWQMINITLEYEKQWNIYCLFQNYIIIKIKHFKIIKH